MAERYRAQVEEYARRWRDLTGVPVSYAGIFSTRHGELSPNLLGADQGQTNS